MTTTETLTTVPHLCMGDHVCPKTVTRPCPHCEVRTVTHRVGAVEVTEVLCKPCLRDLRRPDRTDTLCDCRLPDCGQCTELADKGGARMPRHPR